MISGGCLLLLSVLLLFSSEGSKILTLFPLLEGLGGGGVPWGVTPLVYTNVADTSFPLESPESPSLLLWGPLTLAILAGFGGGAPPGAEDLRGLGLVFLSGLGLGTGATRDGETSVAVSSLLAPLTFCDRPLAGLGGGLAGLEVVIAGGGTVTAVVGLFESAADSPFRAGLGLDFAPSICGFGNVGGFLGRDSDGDVW